MVSEDEAKFAELMLYVARKTRSDHRGGAVKLNKYLYFAEFSAVRRLGRPITGVDYQKLTLGPAPRRSYRYGMRSSPMAPPDLLAGRTHSGSSTQT